MQQKDTTNLPENQEDLEGNEEPAKGEGSEEGDGEEGKIIEELRIKLEKEKEKTTQQEKKIQYLLADFENLKKRTDQDVKNRVDSIADNMILKFLSLYDDFIRAKEALGKQNVDTGGLDAILKNMDSFLNEYGVRPIEALGEVFDPRLHEAISIKTDASLDDNTVIAELRKGYILKDRIIRPSLVEISKQAKEEMN